MTTHPEIISLTGKFIRQTFPLARRRNITDSDNLLESGVIDSLGVLEIVTFLQQQFSLTIEDADLIPENFQDIQSIAGFVERQLAAQQEVLK